MDTGTRFFRINAGPWLRKCQPAGRTRTCRMSCKQQRASDRHFSHKDCPAIFGRPIPWTPPCPITGISLTRKESSHETLPPHAGRIRCCNAACLDCRTGTAFLFFRRLFMGISSLRSRRHRRRNRLLCTVRRMHGRKCLHGLLTHFPTHFLIQFPTRAPIGALVHLQARRALRTNSSAPCSTSGCNGNLLQCSADQALDAARRGNATAHTVTHGARLRKPPP